MGRAGNVKRDGDRTNMFANIKKAIKNPYVFSIISKILIVLVGFLYTVVQSRYLGAEIKGQVAYVTSVTSIAAIVFGFGLRHAYPYFKKNSDHDVLPVFMRINSIIWSVKKKSASFPGKANTV